MVSYLGGPEAIDSCHTLFCRSMNRCAAPRRGRIASFPRFLHDWMLSARGMNLSDIEALTVERVTRYMEAHASVLSEACC